MASRQIAARRGAIVVLAALLMVVLMGLLAFAIDIGKLYVARGELQRTADAAAIAAAWSLIDPGVLTGSISSAQTYSVARQKAQQLARLNQILLQSPELAEEDISFGYMADPTSPDCPFDTSGLYASNAVRVIVRRTSERNAEIPLGFARIFLRNSVPLTAEATAALITDFKGFRTPGDGSNLGILPLALDKETWDDMLLRSGGTDNWMWDEQEQRVRRGRDGIREVNLYPQGTGSPGNRGTVDIGSSNNSTADIARQILHGISPQDLAYHGGKLEFDQNGKLYLNGDTGISAGVKDELASIIGQPRIIPVFSQVTGPGNNATYTIVRFVGVRIMEVSLTGSNSSKCVIVQPAQVVTRGGIPGGQSGQTTFIYSPVRLVK